MNKRIKELAEQAKPVNENGKKVIGLNSEYHDQWMEKFADLIVQDCVWEVVKDGVVPQDIQTLICTRFKEHFGVKR